MVNTLVQAENASSHGFMSELMREGKALVHAMWFDVRSGDLLYFSRREKVGITLIMGAILHVMFWIFESSRLSAL